MRSFINLPIRPPYSVAAELSMAQQEVSAHEKYIMRIVDEMMKSLRIQEFVLENALSIEDRNALLKKHVEAAEAYYGSFSKEDMSIMLLTDKALSMMRKDGDSDDEKE